MKGDLSSGDGCPIKMCLRFGVFEFIASVSKFIDARNRSF